MGGTPFDGTAMVMVDKTVPYRLLTEVLYSAGQAEFRNYHLVVIRRAQ
jgi:biopolymer transport protein ExbD